jgi:hypothetical protein
MLATVSGTMFAKWELSTYENGKLSSKLTFSNVMVVAIQYGGGTDASMTFTYGSMKSK